MRLNDPNDKVDRPQAESNCDSEQPSQYGSRIYETFPFYLLESDYCVRFGKSRINIFLFASIPWIPIHYAMYSREIADSLRNGYFFIYFLQLLLEILANKLEVINHSQKHEYCLFITYILVSFCMYYSGGSFSGYIVFLYLMPFFSRYFLRQFSIAFSIMSGFALFNYIDPSLIPSSYFDDNYSNIFRASTISTFCFCFGLKEFLLRKNNYYTKLQKRVAEFLSSSSDEVKEYIIEGKKLSISDTLLGYGAHSKVYFGNLESYQKPVAVKIFTVYKNVNITAPERKKIMKEIKLLSNFQSPFIISYIASFETNVLILEYATEGDLVKHLTQHANHPEEVNFKMAVDFSIQIAMGLKVLHQREVLHRDLKSFNILVTRTSLKTICKLGDFSSSIFVSNSPRDFLKKSKGALIYTCPELSGSIAYTKEADIYSFGIITFDLFNTVVKRVYSPPYTIKGLDESDFTLYTQVVEGLRPTISFGTPKIYTSLFRKMVHTSPEERPNLITIVRMLESYERNWSEFSSHLEEFNVDITMPPYKCPLKAISKIKDLQEDISKRKFKKTNMQF